MSEQQQKQDQGSAEAKGNQQIKLPEEKHEYQPEDESCKDNSAGGKTSQKTPEQGKEGSKATGNDVDEATSGDRFEGTNRTGTTEKSHGDTELNKGLEAQAKGGEG